MKFEALRQKYPVFIFENYEIKKDNDFIEIEYNFSIENLASFKPKWLIQTNGINVDEAEIKEMVFSLGMAELISYWKITCSPFVKICAGLIDSEQIKWWKKLYYKGLGEFFYLNKIETSIDNFMEIEVTRKNAETNVVRSNNLKGALIPIGGGKDSIVSLDILKDTAEDNKCYIINERDATRKSAETAGFPSNKIISVKRTLDANMLKLNKQGFLNGHTPFSTIVAFSSILIAYLFGHKYIVLSNESSADEATILNSDVNHQYSKSFEFENDFRWYVKKYLTPDIEYFSLLRPLSEYQITWYFSKLKNYHYIFKSCNVGSKNDNWCGNCPKCLFVFIMLSAFLDISYLSDIFGENLLEKRELLKIMEQLDGTVANKPFECVGSRNEINTAICTAIAWLQKEKRKLPYLYEMYLSTPLYTKYKLIPEDYSIYYNLDNNLPIYFANLIKDNFKIGDENE